MAGSFRRVVGPYCKQGALSLRVMGVLAERAEIRGIRLQLLPDSEDPHCPGVVLVPHADTASSGRSR